MLIGEVGRIGTDGFDFGMDEDYHSRTARQDGLIPGPTHTVSALIGTCTILDRHNLHRKRNWKCAQ